MTNKNEAAFPITRTAEEERKTCTKSTKGLTKREYFAGVAMQGLIAGDGTGTLPYLSAAAFAVKYADALIEALNKEVEQ